MTDVTLTDVQDYMRGMTARHGFTTDPHTQMTLIVEEIGELARVVKLVSRGQLSEEDTARLDEALRDLGREMWRRSGHAHDVPGVSGQTREGSDG